MVPVSFRRRAPSGTLIFAVLALNLISACHLLADGSLLVGGASSLITHHLSPIDPTPVCSSSRMPTFAPVYTRLLPFGALPYITVQGICKPNPCSFLCTRFTDRFQHMLKSTPVDMYQQYLLPAKQAQIEEHHFPHRVEQL